MLSFSNLFFGLLLAVPALSAPLSLPPQLGPLKVFKQITKIPSSWTSQGPVKNDPNLKIQIGLKQSNIQGLQKKLEDISDPKSSNYGKWLSQDEIDSYVKPSELNVALVKTWLNLFGISDKDIQQPTSDWIEFTAPLSKVEPLLDTKYELFSHPTAGTVPRTKQYSVPLLLHDFVDLITPTTAAFYQSIAPHVEGPGRAVTLGSHHNASNHHKRQSCDTSAITPSCIESLYNVDYTSQGSQTVATTELVEVAASHSDYSTFAADYVSNLADFTDVSISGGTNAGQGDQNTLLEGNLDTQFSGGLATPNPNQYLALGPSGQSNEDFADQIANFASWLTSVNNPPSSVSTSYGGEEQYYDSDYLNRVCNEFMKAGSRGISVFFSSGDHGVGGNGEQSCSNGFYATWPGACPWITSVGGTQFNGGQEVVAQFSSINGSPGGGFSNVFSRPSYQSSQVSSYLSKLGSEYQGLYNANGRAYPDLALVAVNFQVVVNGEVLSVLGTSASSPSVAALVSTLNDYRVQKGKSTLGFLNPLLYSSGTKSVFNDITSGSNVGCDSNGFPATTGWDAASGLGSPNYAKLRALL